MSEKPLILITGATGHIGFRVLAQVLAAGYRARITTRNASSAEALLTLPSISSYASNITIHPIPDFLASDAFTTAVKDVSYIIHIASPIPDATIDSSTHTFSAEETFIKPATAGTLNLLTAAASSPSVKRIVITASVALLAPPTTSNPNNPFPVGPDDLAPPPTLEQMQSNHWLAYRGSKILAHRAANEWVATHNPHFDVLWVLPGYVMGANEPVRTAQGMLDRASSNGTMLLYALGKDSPGGEPRPLDLVWVDDVAEVHVKLLEADGVRSGERFVASYDGGVIEGYGDIDPIVKRLYPEAVGMGLLPLGGKVIGRRAGYDSGKTERVLGVRFHGLEEMVEGVVGQFVKLSDEESKMVKANGVA